MVVFTEGYDGEEDTVHSPFDLADLEVSVPLTSVATARDWLEIEPCGFELSTQRWQLRPYVFSNSFLGHGTP